MNRNIETRLKKLEDGNAEDDQFSLWLKSLSLDELNDAVARIEIERELKAELVADDPTNQAIFAKLNEAWSPPSKILKYYHETLAELEVELIEIKELSSFIMSDVDKTSHEDLKAKWRAFYLGESLVVEV